MRKDNTRVFSHTMQHTVYYAVQEPTQIQDVPATLLLALHGWGQCCPVFMRSLHALQKRNIVVVAPQAPNAFYLERTLRSLDAQLNFPNACVGEKEGVFDQITERFLRGDKRVGFSWLTSYKRDQAVADVNCYLEDLFVQIRERLTLPLDKMVVMGFSQGSSVAYRYAVSTDMRIDGLISCCADLPSDVGENLAPLKDTSVLLVQGKRDRIAPLKLAYQAEAQLQEAQINVDTHFFDGNHALTPAVVEKIGDWISAL